jgi:hypothetical protein
MTALSGTRVTFQRYWVIERPGAAVLPVASRTTLALITPWGTLTNGWGCAMTAVVTPGGTALPTVMV